MSPPLRLAINGATGRMGAAVLGLLHDDARFKVVAAIAAADSTRAGELAWPDRDTLRFESQWPSSPVDAVIDFSGPAGLTSALDFCLERRVALVSGTTGADASLRARLDQAAAHIPLLHANNFSLGIAVLARLLRQAAAALPDWDLEIIEAHHGRKRDAPSGTALALGEVAATARGTTLGEVGLDARRAGPRPAGGIGFAVVRGGDIVGEHTAMLIGAGERVELSHRATDRGIFARGAIEAAHWLCGRAPGAYDLDAMLADRLT
jgi:4-hydroxy-tetrahydrodipicolinate reductase